jgi:glucokinase
MAYLGVDIGGTKIITAIADGEGRVLCQENFHTPREGGPEAVLAAIETSFRCLMDTHNIPQSEVQGTGIGCGGPLDPYAGRIEKVVNLPGWEGLLLSQYFSDAFSAPAFLDNDVNLAALGEARRGAGINISNMAYLNVGTGIGGGIVIDGRLYRGNGNAAEFGHQIVLPNGPDCPCGNHGCLESLCSGTSIARRAREYLEQNPKSIILESAQEIERVTGAHVSHAARLDDELALKIWKETAKYLGIGVANIINILNPGRIVLGGGVVMKNIDLLFEPAKTVAIARAMPALARDTEIVTAELGEDAGVIGAICLAMEGL